MLALLALLALAAEPAPAEAPPRAPPAAALHVGAGLLLANQVDGNGRAGYALEGGLAFGGARLRGGVLLLLEAQGAFGQFHGAGARVLGAALQAGLGLHAARPGPLEVMLEAGLQRFSLVEPSLAFESWSGGELTRPFLGARLRASPAGLAEGRSSFGVTVAARLSPGTGRTRYTVTSCPILGSCTTEPRQVRYGGAAVLLLLDGRFDLGPRPGAAADPGVAADTDPGPPREPEPAPGR